MGLRVYDLLIEGCSNEEIGRAVGLTVRTTKYHISRILAANKLTNRIELIAAHGRAIHGQRAIEGVREEIDSERQRQVYDLTVAGTNGPKIAKKLGISPRTVKFHHQAILERIGAESQAKLVATHWGTARGARRKTRHAARASGSNIDSRIVREMQLALQELRQQRDRVDQMLDALSSAASALR